MIDVPHCLKNTRNVLFRHYTILYENRMVEWGHVLKLHDLERSSDAKAQLRLAPRLKSVHVNLPMGKNMRVDIAAETLSRTTGKAIRTYVHFERMSSAALDTPSSARR